MERIGTTLDGRIIIAITIDEFREIGKYTATNKEVSKVFYDALDGYGNTEVGKLKTSKVLKKLFVQTMLHSNFTTEDIEAHLSKNWAEPPIFEFDGTIESYLKFSDHLTKIPMVGPKKAREIHQTILSAASD